MNISNLNDKSLLINTENARKMERQYIHLVLQHLKEIYRRKLYLDLGFSSLHEYCRMKLNYTSGESQYRVSCVKLMMESKKIERKLESGELSMSNGVMIHNHYSRDSIKKPNRGELEKIVDQASGKTKLEVKSILKNTPTRIRPSVQTKKEKCRELLEELLNLEDTNEVLRGLEEKIKVKKEKLIKKAKKTTKITNSRYIPSLVKAKVKLRSNGKCEHFGCKKRKNLEYEHSKPFALGGDNSEENIKLFCRAHNQREAIKVYGVEKMQFHFSS